MSKPHNHLPDKIYAYPYTASTTMTTKQLRETLLETEGWVIANGRVREIKSKSLGAGVYKVYLEGYKP